MNEYDIIFLNKINEKEVVSITASDMADAIRQFEEFEIVSCRLTKRGIAPYDLTSGTSQC